MVAVDYASGGQGCNNIITNNSRLIELIKLIKLTKSLVCLQYQRVRFNLNQVMMQQLVCVPTQIRYVTQHKCVRDTRRTSINNNYTPYTMLVYT
jgi:hypothetical protein